MIDVGINRTDAGLVGDVAYAAAAERARADHARPRRRRPDDDRDAAAQHPAGGEGAGGMRRVRTGEIVAGVAGVVLLVSTVPRLVHGARPRRAALTAWAAFCVVDLLVALVALLGIALALSQVVGRGPALPVALGVITTTLALAATLLVLYRILNQPGPNDAIGVARRRLGRPRRLPRRVPRRLAVAQRRAPAARRPGCRRCPSAARPRRAPKISDMTLSRDQVLHVARLARLELTEDEVGPLLGRALEGVRLGRDDRASSATSRTSSRPRTSSPSRTRCAPTSRTPSLSQEDALAAAPDPAQGGFRVPSPGAGGGA